LAFIISELVTDTENIKARLFIQANAFSFKIEILSKHNYIKLKNDLVFLQQVKK